MRRAARSAAPLHLMVIRAGFACTFRGHEYGENLYCFIFLFVTPPSVCASGVGVILTSPSCLVEGVRSGSRRRNAATASSLVGWVPRRNRGTQCPPVCALHYAVDIQQMRNIHADLGRAPCLPAPA